MGTKAASPPFFSRTGNLLLSRGCSRFLGQPLKLKELFSWSIVRGLKNLFRHHQTVSKRNIPEGIPVPAYIKDGKQIPPYSPEIKSVKEINAMRPACKLASSILDYVGQNIKVGMTTNEIDDMVYHECIKAGAYPSPLLYKGFPKSVCTSVNEVACHGIPSSLVLNDGDIINVDITVFYKGFHGDTSRTFLIGHVDERMRHLVNVAKECRDIGIAVCRHGAPFSDIGEAIYSHVSESDFEVIPQFCGHGIGTYFHGPPDIVHVPIDSVGVEKMKEGMTFTVEPIICDGSPEIKILDDKWTVVTTDGSWSAQFEHTILVTHHGPEILT